MTVSVFDLFKLGVGPSSSHTMGPMSAAARFVRRLDDAPVARVVATLQGSLAMTGKGHATDRAVMLGLAGFEPATIDPDEAEAALAKIREGRRLRLGGGREIAFDEAADIVWARRERRPEHPNSLKFAAFDAKGGLIAERFYFSVGGGFVLDEAEIAAPPTAKAVTLPFPFTSGAELLKMAEEADISIAQLMFANECALRPPAEVEAKLDAIWAAMEACVDRGVRQEGALPGGLSVPRRAAKVFAELTGRMERNAGDPLAALDWVNLWALAVNEENAAGGRVVTAPTNGAAGLLPAVLRFYDRFYRGDAEGRRTFLLTAGAIGALYKLNASISGAEVGCQGEVGVACSM